MQREIYTEREGERYIEQKHVEIVALIETEERDGFRECRVEKWREGTTALREGEKGNNTGKERTGGREEMESCVGVKNEERRI